MMDIPGLAWLSQMRLLLRPLRAQAGLTLTLFAVVAATSLVMAAIPRLYHQVLDLQLQYRVEEASPRQANIGVELTLAMPSLDELAACEEERIECRPALVQCQDAGDSCTELLRACREDLARCMDERGAAYQETFPELLGETIASREYVASSPEYTVRDSAYFPDLPADLVVRLRFQSNVERHIELVDGRMPEPIAPISLAEAAGFPSTRGEQPVPAIEIALSEASAAAAGLEVGSLVVLGGLTELRFVTTEDPVTGQAGRVGERFEQPVAVRLSGIFRVSDPDDDYWYGDVGIDRPIERILPDEQSRAIVVTGLLNPRAYGQLQPLTVPDRWTYAWRYVVDPETLTVTNYQTLADELDTLQLTKGSYQAFWSDPGPLRVRNGLTSIFTAFTEQAGLALAVAALTGIGLLAIGVAALAVVTALIAARRRQIIGLLRSRGATSWQLFSGQIVEGLVICLPAAAAGYLLAVLLVPARPTDWAIWGGLAPAICTVLLLVLASSANIRPPLSSLLQRAGEGLTRLSPRRLVAEGVLVLLAAGGIYLLRRRGVAPEPDAGQVIAFDAVLTAVPVLLALAAGLATLRLYPLLLRLLARLVQRGRSLVLFFGLRRAARLSLVDHLPLLVMLLAVGIASFTAVIARSVDEAQQDAAWQEVGAAHRVTAQPGSSLPNRLQPLAIPGVEDAAPAFITPDATMIASSFTRGGESDPLTLLAIDTPAYRAVAAGTRAAPAFPPTLLETPDVSRLGQPDRPIPAIASSNWPANAEQRPVSGETIQISAASPGTGLFVVTFQVVEVRRQFPSIPRETPFLVTSLDAVQTALENRPLRPTTLYLGGNADPVTLEAALREQAIDPQIAELVLNPSFNLEIVSRSEVYDTLAGAPLVTGIANGFRASVVLAALYAGLAAVAALVLSAQLRARDLGYLRTLGLSARQALGLSAVEHLPAVLLAGLLGVGLGAGMAVLVEPGLDLSAFVGPDAPVALQISWPQVGLVAAILVLAVGLAIGVFSLLTRRTQLGEAVRVGDSLS